MASLLKGEIVWAELDPTLGHEQSGRRPVLILSEDIFNARSGTVIAVDLTSQEPRAAFPLTLEIVGSGFPKRSWVKISQIRTLSRTAAWDQTRKSDPRRSGRRSRRVERNPGGVVVQGSSRLPSNPTLPLTPPVGASLRGRSAVRAGVAGERNR